MTTNTYVHVELFPEQGRQQNLEFPPRDLRLEIWDPTDKKKLMLGCPFADSAT
jgi:hypothetical protein